MSDKSSKSDKSTKSTKWDKFTPEINNIKDSITADVEVHKSKAESFKRESLHWKIALIVFPMAVGVLGSLASRLGCPYTTWFTNSSSLFIVPAIAAFYTWRSPETKRAEHISAAASKAGINRIIIKELTLDEDDRQPADSFYDWIAATYDDECSDAPFIVVKKSKND